MKCRNCKSQLNHQFADLGSTPLANSLLSSIKQLKSEKHYKLKILICNKCWLVQTLDQVKYSKIFNNDYVYFSSFSKYWLNHSRLFVDKAIKNFKLNENSFVVEVASNDGYLLQYFKNHSIPCLGIEPTKNTAAKSEEKGIMTIKEFFTESLAKKLRKKKYFADLIIANNVLAHVPDVKDFVKGFALLLKSNGVACFEFPHLYNLIKYKQFDTIYHEHFSYFSFISVNNIFKECGLKIIDVEKIQSHGGSLRIYAQRKDNSKIKINNRVKKLLNFEKKNGINNLKLYLKFQEKIDSVTNRFKEFIHKASAENKKIIAYGAAAKGNTLLNYAEIKSDAIKYVVDLNPSKQDKFMPGSGIPILEEKIIKEYRPDYIIILPWNLKDEIKSNLKYVRNWGAKFVTAIPKLDIS